uniref:Uncharacterized protein n=1 Tax=Oncorhynchus kisutch TaxID=8019 RepID=A0A8C7KPF2_ONCKI
MSMIDCSPPPNFSWVEPIKLARLALPQMTSYYLYLLDNCIRHLVCLFTSIGVAVYCIHGHGRTGTMLAKTRKISGTDEIRRAQITNSQQQANLDFDGQYVTLFSICMEVHLVRSATHQKHKIH